MKYKGLKQKGIYWFFPRIWQLRMKCQKDMDGKPKWKAKLEAKYILNPKTYLYFHFKKLAGFMQKKSAEFNVFNSKSKKKKSD